jgi:hypothetical protein
MTAFVRFHWGDANTGLKLPNFAAAYQKISSKSLCSSQEVINELSIPVGFVQARVRDIAEC